MTTETESSSDNGVVALHAQIPYADAPSAAEWLQQAFGFAATMSHHDDDGGLAHCELRLGGAAVVVFSDRAGYDRPSPKGETVGFSLYLSMADDDAVDRLFERAAAAGAEVVLPPATSEWGNHRFRVRDPQGQEWTFGTHRPGLPPQW